MKKVLLLLVFAFAGLINYAQIGHTKNYNVYLLQVDVTEFEIAKSMEMTAKKQFFYEGEIEVLELKTDKKVTYRFYFSLWDENFKEFLVKDMSYNILAPEFTFNNNEKALFVEENKVIEVPLDDNTTIDKAIISNMMIWLEGQTKKETSKKE